jgi:hypothetical protein
MSDTTQTPELTAMQMLEAIKAAKVQAEINAQVAKDMKARLEANGIKVSQIDPVTGDKKQSPNAKATRNTPAGMVTTWIPLDLYPADNEIVRKASRYRDQKIGDLLANITKQALDLVWDEIKRDSILQDEKEPPKSIAEMETELEKKMLVMTALQEKIEQMKELRVRLEAEKGVA